jgi:hypothetical protein
MKKKTDYTDEKILNQIYLIRGQKVMIDSDLAVLYNVETRQLKRAVRRNINRFPPDFMFELTQEEFENQRCQIGTANSLRYRPFCFTEQGVTMLACLLNSDVAIEMNVRIIRLFTKMREVLRVHHDILKRLQELERNVASHDGHINQIFAALKFLIKQDEIRIRTKTIGFNKNRE